MNHLEQLVAEWLQYNGYFVRQSVPVGKRAKGGFEGELDVVGYKPGTKHLLHVECSLDSDSWSQRKARFQGKLERGRKYIRDMFPGIALPDKTDQKIVLQYTSAGHAELAGAAVVSVRDLIHEVVDGLRETSPASGAVPSTLPLLRTLQLAADALAKDGGGARLIPVSEVQTSVPERKG